MGENEYGKSSHLFIFIHFFEALIGAFEAQFFFRALFLHLISETLIVCRAMQLRYFACMETLLNNSFNINS